MINDDTTTLFEPEPDLPPQVSIRQGIVQSWNAATGENTVQFAGSVFANVQALKSESANLVAGDVVALLVTGDQCLVLGKVTTPGNPGTVPSWNGDILALQTDVVTAQTTANTGVTNAAAAQSTANAAQADATSALSKFPITSTDISDGAISTPKLSANAIDGMTITGSLLRTAASGQRVEIDSPTATNRIQFFTTDTLGDPGHISVGGDGTNGFIEIASPQVDSGDSATINFGSIAGASYINVAATDIDISANAGRLTLEGLAKPVFAADAPSLAVSLTTTYAAGSTVLGTAFTAPATGKVKVTVGGRMQLSTANNTLYLGFEVREGDVVGSGTPHTAADNGRTVAVGGNATGFTFLRIGASRTYLIEDLTPGASYNIRAMHACQSGTASGTLFNRDLLVEPVL